MNYDRMNHFRAHPLAASNGLDLSNMQGLTR